MNPMPNSPESANPAPSNPGSAPLAAAPIAYPLRFTGKGSEYFKIWIVNLLLILVTVGLYYPWAKLRKQKYLHRNLILDGAAFDYHAKPKALFIGMVVALALSGAYFLMGSLDSLPALLVITGILCALVPWLIWKAFRFRLAVTTYRALPFKFVGSLKEAYILIAPQFVVLALIDWALMGIKDDAAEGLPPSLKWVGIVYLLLLVFVPALHLFLKKYQHNHYQWTSLQTQIDLGYQRMYAEYLKYFGIVFLCVAAFTAAVTAFIAAMSVSIPKVGPGSGVFSFAMFFGFIALGLSYAALYAVIASQFTARFQNLIWNQTTAQGVVFKSELQPWVLFKLYFKNSLLTLITAGIYWPFAAMKVAQLRAASMTVHADAPLMMLAAARLGEAREQNAVGDAVGDVFGVDIGM